MTSDGRPSRSVWGNASSLTGGWGPLARERERLYRRSPTLYWELGSLFLYHAVFKLVVGIDVVYLMILVKGKR